MALSQVLDSCGSGCGVVAALFACLGFGSFGAPLKSEAVNMVQPDPFVLQTYKSAMCFVTCWCVLPLGVQFIFTPWGILSGILWVSGGVCGIFGIRNAGLAVSVGTWSSVTVLISFAWGIFLFGEQVQSVTGTTAGVIFLLLGFTGMTYFSQCDGGDGHGGMRTMGQDDGDDSSLTEPLLDSSDEEACETDASEEEHPHDGERDVLDHECEHDNDNNLFEDEDEQRTTNALPTDKLEHDDTTTNEATSPATQTTSTTFSAPAPNTVQFLGRQWNRKTLGILGAAMDGILGGSNLIPMKIAPSIDRGLDYVISFAIGATIATILGWIIYFAVSVYNKKSLRGGYNALPSFYFDKILFQGVLSGALWSVGNVSQILTVTFLGESIGMSIVQSQMIVSGLLGIILFREIKGMKKILCWVLSAVVTFAGIVLLSQEHKS